ncbi:MAG: outer membrane lipoprotein-sorting protein [Bacteroidia bacterium]|nr:outer membrane lipoprotein-sorting protein [Bacteroidales bacterium]MDD3961037.1 outer membrane lipoprotein-sorting protein [Bacteroidales bacterium]MDY0286133.1 outer membrane lipoprotein-sorting protein [Bacteroidales bacterium]NCD41301.1 outer membrane lipoprotein-sorting protein [Bacteroidia bacterium]HPE86683.1 outer membrane lipoprotein-sorting protein [Bacteroidales bacterium]
MKKITLIILAILPLITLGQYPDGKEVLDRIDKNMTADRTVTKASMVVHGRRSDRTMEMITYTEGERSYSEYLAPAREKGTKMLKLEDKLYIYSPSTDRTIQISGHMLRQSMMGSDLSYEDMMEENKLEDAYDAVVTGEEKIEQKRCYILELIANKKDVNYYMRKVWVDTERYIPMKEELYAKSGKMLKTTILSDIRQVDGRWYPYKIAFKDMLKSGEGTEFIVEEISFNKEIPEHLFTKGALRK